MYDERAAFIQFAGKFNVSINKIQVPTNDVETKTSALYIWRIFGSKKPLK